jgi:Ca2+:H+ antiporter
MTANIAYAVIAEILVNTVESVLDNVDIDEKFLGITLFALVPNTTEFLNAISFAMNGNIALSMEIGSAYALQVCLLQIPALVLYSAVYGRFIDPMDIMDHTFTLIFPQWDMVTVILCVFLLRYIHLLSPCWQLLIMKQLHVRRRKEQLLQRFYPYPLLSRRYRRLLFLFLQ